MKIKRNLKKRRKEHGEVAAAQHSQAQKSFLFHSVASLAGASVLDRDIVDADYHTQDFEQDLFTQQFEDPDTEAAYLAFVCTSRATVLVVLALEGFGFLLTGYQRIAAGIYVVGFINLVSSLAAFLTFVPALAVVYPPQHEALQKVTLFLLNAERLEGLHVWAWMIVTFCVAINEFSWLSAGCTKNYRAGEHSEDYCRKSLLGYEAINMMVSLTIFQIRAVITIPGCFISVGLLCLGYPLAAAGLETDDVGLVQQRPLLTMRFMVLLMYLAVMIATAIVQEIQNRSRFVRWAEMKRTEGLLVLHRAAIANIVMTLLPGDSVSRLVANEEVRDERELCGVAVVKLDDYHQWCTTLLPKDVVLVLDRLCCALDDLTVYPVEKVGFYGDVFVTSLGLRTPFHEGMVQIPEGTGQGVDGVGPLTALLVHCFHQAVKLATTDWVTIPDWESGGRCDRLRLFEQNNSLRAKIGVAVGPCVGGLVGSNLKYNLSGAAFSRASEAAQRADPGTVVATEELLAQCQEKVFGKVSAIQRPAGVNSPETVILPDGSRAFTVIPMAQLVKQQEQQRQHTQRRQAEAEADADEMMLLSISNGEPPVRKKRRPSEEELDPVSQFNMMLHAERKTVISGDGDHQSGGDTNPWSSHSGNRSFTSTFSADKELGGVNLTMCGVIECFKEPKQEAAYREFTLQQDREMPNRIVDSLAGFLFCSMLLVVPVYSEVYNTVGIIGGLVGFLVVGLRLVAVDCLPAKISPFLITLQLLVFMATAALNPPNLLNGQVIMLLVMCHHTVLVAVPRASLTAELCLLVLNKVGCFVIFVLSYGEYPSTVLETGSNTVFYSLGVLFAVSIRDKRRREHFTNVRRSEIAMLWVQEERKTLNALLAKLVPEYAVSIVKKRTVVEDKTARVMKPLCDVIVIEVTLTNGALPLFSSSHREKQEAGHWTTATTDDGKNTKVDAVLVRPVAQIERLIKEFGGGMLNIVNILGDSIQIAGPLKAPQRNKGPVEDFRASAVELHIGALVKQQQNQDKRLFACLANVMRFIDSAMSQLGDTCTLVLSSGSGFGAVIGSHPPQFSVLGVTSHLAAVISHSVPVTGYVYCSSSFHNLVLCHAGIELVMEELDLEFGVGATWRLRGAGSQQVRMLRRHARRARGSTTTTALAVEVSHTASEVMDVQ